MNRSRRGWVASGDRRKVLVNYDDDYNTFLVKCCNAIDFTTPNPMLIAGGAIVGEDSFRNISHYIQVSHVKPAKLVFGIAEMSEDDPNSVSQVLSSNTVSSDSGLPRSCDTRKNTKVKVEAEGSSLSPVIIGDDDGPSTSTCTKFAQQLRSLGLHVYSDHDILQLTGQLQKMEFVRAGGFGEVFVGTFGQQKVALKKVKGDKATFKCGLQHLANEAELLTRYRHRHLVPIVGVCPGPRIPAILYEYMEEGSLYDHVHTLNDITELQENVRILWESSQGLSYLHASIGSRNRVTHCDVKSSNILLDDHLVAKVGDFGLAKTMPQVMDGMSYVKCAEFGGSLGYQAPEILEGEISPKLDVYSLAVVIVDVYSGMKAYDKDRTYRKLVDHVQSDLQTLPAFERLRATFYEWYEALKYDDLRLLILGMLKPRGGRLSMYEVEQKLEALYIAMLRA